MSITRAAINPLITPNDVPPSSPDLKVVSVFNAAATTYQGETILLLRVAETVREVAPDEVAVPVLDCDPDDPRVYIMRIPRNTPGLDLSDSRAISFPGCYLLSSLSHLRVARSRDGLHFTIEEAPALFPCTIDEEYGIEDPRITLIDGTYYISYTVVSRNGIAVGLASTTDFKTYQRHGIIFSPENKNVAIFPEKINGLYYAFHRPATGALGNQQIWLATSPDLHHWGRHRPLIGRRTGMWDETRIGAGSVPFKTAEGWLAIYHGVNPDNGYCLGAVLMDLETPSRILARSERPILVPKEPYECLGFYGNVVFTCGSVVREDGNLYVYYGAADEHMCCAWVAVDEILDSLRTTNDMPETAVA